MSPAIEKFLSEFEETKGFGLAWKLHEGFLQAELNEEVFCCPLTAGGREDAVLWEDSLGFFGLSRDEGLDIVFAADRVNRYDTAIRDRLLAAVGLSEPSA